MTPQEAQMLQDLVRKVEGTQLTEKDPDAEALLQDGVARDPDALYKLAQTVLIQNMALEQARARMQQMQQQLAPPAPQPAKATSFLGGLFHRDPQPASAGQQPPYTPVNTGQPPQYQQPYTTPYQGQPAYQAPPPAYYPPPAPAGGGFLRSAATTAAGVAGGMLAFEGIESLMHGGMHEGFGGGWGGGMAGAPMGEETVINNYYGDPSQQPGADPREIPGPDEQPQGPFQTGQDQGSAQDYLNDSGANDQGYQEQADDQGYLDDSGGGQDYGSDAGDSGGQDFGDDSGGDSGGF
jgi:uncharacterized protein